MATLSSLDEAELSSNVRLEIQSFLSKFGKLPLEILSVPPLTIQRVDCNGRFMGNRQLRHQLILRSAMLKLPKDQRGYVITSKDPEQFLRNIKVPIKRQERMLVVIGNLNVQIKHMEQEDDDVDLWAGEVEGDESEESDSDEDETGDAGDSEDSSSENSNAEDDTSHRKEVVRKPG